MSLPAAALTDTLAELGVQETHQYKKYAARNPGDHHQTAGGELQNS